MNREEMADQAILIARRKLAELNMLNERLLEHIRDMVLEGKLDNMSAIKRLLEVVDDDE